MSNKLQQTLDEILLDKNTNLLPENLKEGVTCLGVTGTAQLKDEEEYNRCVALSDTILGNTISGYTPLNYIQSNGKQCIELNYQYSVANTKIELTTSDIIVDTNKAIFGNGLWTMSTPVLVSDSNLAYNYYSYGINVTTDLLTKHNMSFYRGVVILDGETISNTDTIHGNVSGNTILFGGTKNSHLSSFKLYSCRILENDIVKLDLKPMMNEAGDIGLYDIINNKFYTSTTSTKFIAG